jgi:SAM-dependent methyltransferase
MDSSPAFANLAKQILEPKFDYKNASFEEFEFKTGTYDLISAQFALPFNNPKTFNLVLSKIFESLAPEGVFTAQLFGVRDEWNTADSGMTFHSKEEVEKLFESMDVVYFNEVEKEAPMASGASKHWHLFEIIAKKPSVDGKE